MSLIYNILLLIGMNKRVKQYVVSNYFKSFNTDNVFIRLVCLLFILAACIICAYLLYRAVSNALYMYRLKTAFNKLKDMGLDVKNYNIIYSKELGKKYIPNSKKVLKKIKGEFKNKNAIGLMSDKYVVIDIDYKNYNIGNPDVIMEKIPKDTVSEKTPNGYHYYFENDTGKPIQTYVQISINNVKYSLDIIGNDSVTTMSPTRVNGKDYYWINSIFTHKPAKISENMWILDLIKDEIPFFKKFNEMFINIKNAFVIVNNIYIEYYIVKLFTRIKLYTKKIKFLDGTIYIYDDNYYFLTNNTFFNYKNKKKLLHKMTEIINELNPSCIIDLSITYSNYLKNKTAIQIKSTIIDDDYKTYKYDNYFPTEAECKLVFKKTNYLIEDTVTIKNYDIKNVLTNILKQGRSNNTSNEINEETIVSNNNKKFIFGPESIYISILLSNHLNIPCFPYSIVINTIEILKENENDKDKGNIQKIYGKVSKNIISSLFSAF